MLLLGDFGCLRSLIFGKFRPFQTVEIEHGDIATSRAEIWPVSPIQMPDLAASCLRACPELMLLY
ncbi:hypothetical protein MUK42_33724 [Musa troglodytarum]|uniref:Uncharacterized protein n=1 Tax=Musa troglodytarum TaxID=320322 RepID=A0A9E7KBG8_9LILI|nr:hypothetical protein MUK42_33724 [Musa troglodytarum]